MAQYPSAGQPPDNKNLLGIPDGVLGGPINATATIAISAASGNVASTAVACSLNINLSGKWPVMIQVVGDGSNEAYVYLSNGQADLYIQRSKFYGAGGAGEILGVFTWSNTASVYLNPSMSGIDLTPAAGWNNYSLYWSVNSGTAHLNNVKLLVRELTGAIVG